MIRAGTSSTLLVAAALATAALAPTAAADERIRLREDTVLRWAPRYVLTADESSTDAERLYWRRVDQLPLYQRVSLTATGLGDGLAEIHFLGWGALDLATIGEAAGDVAIAHVRVRAAPFSAWAGRRFVPWGPPGGLQLDGIGVELQASFGLFAEIIAGRPVTPTHGPLGAQPSFEGAAGAGGVRVGWLDVGRAAVAASYVERWERGVPDRTLAFDASWSLSWLDLTGVATLDAAVPALEQASLEAAVLPARGWMFTGAYRHVDPSLLLPRWSILSVFETSRFDEGVLSATWRPMPGLALRPEVAARRWTSTEQMDDGWGWRAGWMVRWNTADGTQAVLEGSWRDQDRRFLWLRAASARTMVPRLRIAGELAAAIDPSGDEPTALLLAASAESPLGRGWTVGLTVEGAQTRVAEREMRALVRAGWQSP